ncbi:MAG: hypothetical protein WA769_07065 [Pseudolabrys sp.]
MFFDGGYTYSNFLMNVIAIFAFVVWFWLLVVIFGDLVRRHDISGWGKALWVIGLVLFSYLGILAYLITQGRGMADVTSSKRSRRATNFAVWSASARQTRSPSSTSYANQVR